MHQSHIPNKTRTVPINSNSFHLPRESLITPAADVTHPNGSVATAVRTGHWAQPRNETQRLPHNQL